MNNVKKNIGSDLVLETKYPIYYGLGVYRRLSTDELYVVPFSRLQNVNTDEQFVSISTKVK